MSPIPKEQLELLKAFVQACKLNPGIIHTPELGFYREYLESLGATIPPVKDSQPSTTKDKPDEETDEKPKQTSSEKHQETTAEQPAASESSDEEDESDVDIDLDFVIKPETEPLPTLPGIDKEPSEEDMDKANEKRREALMAASDGNMEAALIAFEEAIQLNPLMAVLYAKRAQLFVRLKRPNAAIQDCDRALELNADSALGYKQRGRAYRLLGKIVDAYKDLGKGQQIDYDDDTAEIMKELKDNVHKVQEHENRMAIRNREKEIKRKKKEAARRRAQAQKEYEERQKQQSSSGMPGGFPGGMPGGFPGGMGGGMPGGMGGGMPGGMGGMSGLEQILKDPELLQCFSDPEVSQAFAEVSQNPEKIEKYKDNPKVKSVLDKLMKKFQGGDATPGSTGSESSGGAAAGASTANSTPTSAPSGPSPSSMDLD